MNESEQILVGALLVSGTAYDRVASRVSSADFEDGFLGRVFDQCREHAMAGKPCDVVTVGTAMRDGSAQFMREDWDRVMGLSNNAFGLSNLEVYADAVRQQSNRRRLRDACSRVQNVWASTSAEEMAAMLQGAIEGMVSVEDDTVLLNDAIDHALARIDRAVEARQKGKPVGVPSGLPHLDAATGGAMPGEFLGVAARTSVGKTAFINGWALYAAKLGYRVAVISLEETPADIAFRSMAARLGFNVSRMRLGYEQRSKVERILDQTNLRNLPVWINTRKERLSELVAFIADMKRRNQIAIAFVDHIGLINSEMGPRVPRNEQVGQVTRTLKQLSQRLEIPIVGAIQLNRAAEEKDRPALHHLAESGNIERDLNVAIFLHRKAGQQEQAKEIDVEIGVLKSRYGIRGWLQGEFRFDGPHQRFIENGPPPTQESE